MLTQIRLSHHLPAKSALRKLQRRRLNSPTVPKKERRSAVRERQTFQETFESQLTVQTPHRLRPLGRFSSPSPGGHQTGARIDSHPSRQHDRHRKKMALLRGAPDCNQETSRYSGIMQHLISIYKNDFVKDIWKNLASHPLLAVCQNPALPNK
jgi:uncharacterized protein YcaQ